MWKRLPIILLVMVLPLLFSGCKYLFLREEQPKTLEEKNNNEQDKTSLMKIKDFVDITQGIVSDVSPHGNEIIALKPQDDASVSSPTDNTSINNLFIYDMRRKEEKTILASQTSKSLGRFDPTGKGIYYLESKDQSSYQLFWVDDEGNKKIKISSSEHEVNPRFYITSENNVFYGTKDGKIVKANKLGVLYSINIGEEYSIEQIYYSEEKDLVIFSAFKNDVLSMYSVQPDGKNPTLFIENILGSFDISRDGTQLIYMTPIPDSNKRNLWLLTLDSTEESKLIEGYPQSASFSPNGKKVLYTDKTDVNSDRQNIWILNLHNLESKQIASNLRIISRILWHPSNERILFSSYQLKDSQVQFFIHSLEF
ncbi:hypothetical protein NSA47_09210 [Irregularibacter muris]|uniref:Uncharacterized protein n=1 Tax=Irregularibacter muris TaxID=1796619 RepID=A0AAE3KZU2_9FIRM|nr:hypothetical protein [Irregularibacter muris]MCR1899161.1 hypothetical protein [Irregularibacter muris]